MRIFTLIALLLITKLAWSQNYKFGKVSKAELEEAFYPLDSTADAAVLYSKRRTSFEFDKEEGFYIEEKYFFRLKIYTKEGFDKATNKVILFHNQNGEEKVLGLKATTYNLENGKIEKTKLKKANIFKEKINKYRNATKYTMPNIKPGSVVEWSYTINSPFFGEFREIVLQYDIPIKKNDVKIAIPEYFNYNAIIKGYLQFSIQKESKNRVITFSDIERSGGIYTPTKSKAVHSNFDFIENVQTISLDNVPALKDEYLSGNIDNYKAGINYELSLIKYPYEPPKSFATDWESVVETIYYNSFFGDQLKKNNHFKGDIQNLTASSSSIDEKINIIFEFVKSKIKWNDYNGFYTDNGVKKAYKEGVGNVADINLNLIAMLQYAGLDANPVLVSTVNHGIPLFPSRSGFNYVIAHVVTPNGNVLLDATEKNAMPNILPYRVLNFRGRVVKDNGESDWAELYPKKHSISKNNISAKFDGQSFTGSGRKTITNHFPYNYRNKAQDLSKEELIEWIDDNKKGIEVIKARVQNMDDLNKSVTETIQFETENFYDEIGEKTYINPLLYEQILKNPFKSEKRDFPVFFNTPWAESIVVVIKIPEEYNIETIPESVNYTLPENIGAYNYELTKTQNSIQIKSTIVINKPVIAPNYYQDLKEFYKKVITKQNEKIVLSK